MTLNMGTSEWEHVKQLFQSALDLPPDERAVFLDEACAGKVDLRREVESLIGAYQKADGFIDNPAVDEALKLVQEIDRGLPAGHRIGPYRVINEIGEGGMGVVYLAARADDQYQKQVAIKLVRHDSGNTFIINRFLAERQILANLDHANIARLLEGGTTETGLPYLVMEHIEGLPIDQYSDHHKLSTVERLELFRTVCTAVQYAHGSLVIHRDIKPSNILVTPDGTPKLLDFGIAKILSAEGAPHGGGETATAVRLMTPEYASPEQVRGQAITTATDIYSLGVLLYKLLTGHHPYRFKTPLPQEIERVICEEQPERPSAAVSRAEEISAPSGAISRVTPETVSADRGTPPDKLGRLLNGDLDNIVLMAIRKEPERRYSSVEQFSEDIRRYLDGLPVLAHKDTFRYRASKFVNRHRIGVAAAVVIGVTLVGGIVSTTWQARLARIQRTRAEQRFNDVRRLASSLFEIDDSMQNLAGSTPTRQLLVTRALEYLDSLTSQSGGDTALERELATAYEKVGDIQGNPYTPNIGDVDGALVSYRKALAIRSSLKDPTVQADLQRELGVSYRSLGDALGQKGDIAGSVENYKKSLAIFEQLRTTHPKDLRVSKELATAYQTLGDGLSKAGDQDGEMESYHKGLAVNKEMAAADPANRELRRGLAIALLKLSDEYFSNKSEAVDSLRESASILENLSVTDQTNARARRELAFCLNRLGELLSWGEEYAPALENYRKALVIREALAAEDPRNTQVQMDLAGLRINISELLAYSGQGHAAVESGLAGVAGIKALTVLDPSNMIYLRGLARSYKTLAEAYCRLGADVKSAVVTRVEGWRDAKSTYQGAQAAYLKLRDHGALRPSDKDKPEEMAAEVKECDAAMTKLSTRAQRKR
ncbi:MAG TPA: protein kinase [Blastocatellia bacterium]|nr:protein kinase [Blastocatellia bacterium]